jgi:hypothetical protein
VLRDPSCDLLLDSLEFSDVMVFQWCGKSSDSTQRIEDIRSAASANRECTGRQMHQLLRLECPWHYGAVKPGGLK